MISKRIKELRTEKNLTQKELANLLSLTPKMISFYELGQRTPPSDIILKLAEIFNVSTDYLLGRESDEYDKLSNDNLPELNKKDEKDIAKELEKMMSDLDSDGGLSFYGEPLDDDNKEILRTSLENTLRLSKQLAKKKFTPKKYRKE
ncbi:helix-turn-helix domain-containing protein [Pectinatus frisingensis]|uniref:helix-turn-helix domain-containing protein n=1 Tax=Pectinatus frisingensis TaxID=865 RepID=UPI0018C60A99|nr:helix-turn-helix transcriptional regulator [Pectinatus frisingensis]